MYKGYYNIKNDKIILDSKLQGLSKIRWLYHELIHKYLYKLFGFTIGKYINLLWDILDNEISLIPFYYKSFNDKQLKNFGGGGETVVTSHTYYYYRIIFPHRSIDPSQSIIFYDAYGDILQTIPPYYQYMNYGIGTLSVPGTEQNNQIESVSTATYYVFYSTSDLIIDYENCEFQIAKSLLKNPAQSTVKATFEYLTVFTPARDVASVIDGRWDTQVQTVFYAEPPTDYQYAILDLGSIYTIQALDIVAGFYKPDDTRKYDIQMDLTIKYSTDGINYYDISDESNNFKLTGGESKSFEEKDLGIDFQTRYLKLILEDVAKIEYGAITVTVSDSNRQDLIDDGVILDSVTNGTIAVIRSGCWIVAITEIAAYDDIIIRSEATLIPTTYLSSEIDLDGLNSGEFPTTINVDSTEEFDSFGTSYIDNGDGTFDSFTYTNITSTSFTGIQGLSSSHSIDDMVVQELEGDSTYYDYNGLLPKFGDRLYKQTEVDENLLYDEDSLNYLTKIYLREFQKDHSKIQEEVLYSPHLEVGQTIEVIDTYGNINDNYFIESITDNNGFYQIVLGKYPGF